MIPAEFGLYINDVNAGASGATVMVIPAVVASRLMDPKSCFNAALLAKLKHRLLLRNVRLTKRLFVDRPLGGSRRLGDELDWQLKRSPDPSRKREARNSAQPLPLDPNSLEPESARPLFFIKGSPVPFKELTIDKYQLGRLAGVLLQLAEIERFQLRRCVWAHCVFGSFDKLRELTEINELSTVSELLRLLHCLRVLDIFPFGSLKGAYGGDMGSDDLASRVEEGLMAVLSREARKRLSKILGEDGIRESVVAEAHKLVTRWCAESLGVNLWSVMKDGDDNGHTKSAFQMTRAYRSFKDSIWRFRELPKLSYALEEILHVLARINRVLRTELPYLIVIHDLPIIRALAFNPEDELEPLLFARGLICEPRRSIQLSKLSALAEELHSARQYGRLRMYASALFELVRSDLEDREGTLCFSTNNSTDAVPTPREVSVDPQ